MRLNESSDYFSSGPPGLFLECGIRDGSMLAILWDSSMLWKTAQTPEKCGEK